MTRAGRLRDRVTILELSKAVSGTGHRAVSYATTTTIVPAQQWAAVVGGPGRERVEADALVKQSDFEVTFRYILDLTADFRLQLESGEVLEITGVTSDQYRRNTVCVCTSTSDDT